MVPPVGCRGRPDWGELSDKAYGFSACLHRRRSLRHCVGDPRNGGKQHLETTCAEHYAYFEHIFDDTPILSIAGRALTTDPSALARLQPADAVASLRRHIRLNAERKPNVAGRQTCVQSFQR
jgi:hypothetical protein